MKKSSLFIYVLMCVMFISLPAIAVYAGDGDESVSANSASEDSISENVIEIGSASEFMLFADGCKVDSYSSGSVFKLVADIDLRGEEFSGIPYFNGTFEGDNHTIVFGTITVKGSNQGFIRFIGPSGVVREVNIEGTIKAEGSQNAIGGIVGVNRGVVSECVFRGEVNGADNVGGICGINKEGAVLNACTNYANVLATNYTGGVCGRNEGTITSCRNEGNVNTEELDSSLDLGAVDVGALNISQNVMNRNDAGGIAGCSSGVIRMCTNYGEIGYVHTGYNVAGIVGRQDGIVTVCVNYGNVYGRKDVGGIVGQAEPFIESDYLSDKVDSTREDLNNLSDTLSGISSSISSTSSETKRYAKELNDQYRESLDTVSANIAEITASVSETHPEAQEYVDNINNAMANIERLNESKDYLEKFDVNKYLDENGKLPANLPDDVKKYVSEGVDTGDDINAMLNNSIISEIQSNMDIVNENLDQVYKLYGDTGSTSDEFLQGISDEIANSKTAETVEDMIDAIDRGTNEVLAGFDSAIEQTNNMVNNVSDDLDYLLNDDNNYIEDISSVNVATDMDGVISFCINRGHIDGDINAGGIAGTMNIEYDLDPEYDLDMTETLNIKVRSTVNDVIMHCINYGEVKSKKDYAGGTTGHQEVGVIFDCESYGAICASDGDLLGGIAGYSASSIISCYSLCRLDGGDNIGGVVGQGYTVQDCVTICNIKSDGECIGAIAGFIEEEGSTKNNYFVSDELEGIDGISYSGMAEHLSYDELVRGRELPGGFRTVTIDFVADDKCISQVNIRYGSVIDEKDIPEAPEKDGYYASWQLENTEDGIYNSIVVEAEYKPWKKSVSSEQAYTASDDTEKLKPVFIIAGSYYDDTIIDMKTSDGPVLEETDTLLYAYNWELISEKGLPSETAMVEGHFYADGNEKKASVYVKYDDSWQKVTSKIDGGYLVAIVPINGEFAVVLSEPDYTYINMYIAIGAIVILSVIFIIVRRKNKKTVAKNSVSDKK